MAFFEELSQFKQWVTYRHEQTENGSWTKVPYNPITGRKASSVDPDTWVDIHTAYNGNSQHYHGAGFMLSEEDGLTCGDLDNPFVKKHNGVVTPITQDMGEEYESALAAWNSYPSIIRDFNSYTEWSPSRAGFHIWMRGKLPEAWGSRKGSIELYSRKRFITITGWQVEGTPGTINERQGTLEYFAKLIGLDTVTLRNVYDGEQVEEDAAVLDAIRNSQIGAAFDKLNSGDLSAYPSGSEADQAFANYIGAFTNSLEQAERIFRNSGLFKVRTKLHNRSDLVTRVVRNSFDLKPPPITAENLRTQIDAVNRARVDVRSDEAPAEQPVPTVETTYTPLGELHPVMGERPDGLIGEIADFLYASSPRSLAEPAIAGAISIMAGICGRAFNVSATGLNHYVVMIGQSGVGKEAVSSGLSRLMNELSKRMPSAAQFIGPNNIQSAPGLYKMFVPQGTSPATNSVICQIPEFGQWLRKVTWEHASENANNLKRAVLDLYGKSGRGNRAGGFKYSDNAKDMPYSIAPSFSFIGDTVPHAFYDACTLEAIDSGLVSRLTLIEYRGDRPPYNEAAATIQPSTELISRMIALCETAHARNQTNMPADVGMTVEAKNMFDAFNAEIDRRWNRNKHNSIVQNVTNRSHLKAMKLAALRAVGNNWQEPLITGVEAEWGIRFARSDAHAILSRFDLGEISGGAVSDDRQRAVLKILAILLARKEPFQPSYKIPVALQQAGVYPLRTIRDRAVKTKAFAAARSRIVNEDKLLTDTLKELSDNGYLQVIDANNNWLKALGAYNEHSNAKYIRVLDTQGVIDYGKN